MHSAPSVTYPVGRCALVTRVYLIFIMLTSAIGLLWTLYQPWHHAMAVAVLVLMGGAYLGWKQIRWHGLLRWQDEAWELRPSKANTLASHGEVRICLDLQHVLLLRFKPLHANVMTEQWLWLERQAQANDWLDLRRAVYARSHHQRKEAV